VEHSHQKQGKYLDFIGLKATGGPTVAQKRERTVETWT